MPFDRSAWLTAADVDARLSELACPIPHTRLDRWRTIGLLPKSYRSGRGRGLGRAQAQYDPITPMQAAASVWFFKVCRKADVVGWRLWCAGFEVAEKYALRPLRRAAGLWGRTLPRIRELLNADDDEAWSDLVQELSQIKAPPIFAQVRKSLGPARFGTALSELLRMGAGEFDELAIYPYPNSAEFLEAVRTMDLALGLTNARTDHVGNVGPLIAGDYSEELRAVSDRLAGADLTHDLAVTPLADYRDIARRAYALNRGIAAFSTFVDSKFGPNTFGLRRAALIASVELTVQALMILAWRRIEDHPLFRGRMEELALIFINTNFEFEYRFPEDRVMRTRLVFPFEEWARRQQAQ
jgi:hypothetical protein